MKRQLFPLVTDTSGAATAGQSTTTALPSVMGELYARHFVGVGWNETDAPVLNLFMKTMKVGDVVYIKAYPPGSQDIVVKGIGIIADDTLRHLKDTNGLF